VLFISSFEIGRDLSEEDIIEASQTLAEAGMWSPEGMEVIRWDTTVNDWGIVISEANDYETTNRSWTMWEALVPGIFAAKKMAPAAPVEESMAQSGALLEELWLADELGRHAGPTARGDYCFIGEPTTCWYVVSHLGDSLPL